jgi:hypothetical protein
MATTGRRPDLWDEIEPNDNNDVGGQLSGNGVGLGMSPCR